MEWNNDKIDNIFVNNLFPFRLIINHKSPFFYIDLKFDGFIWS